MEDYKDEIKKIILQYYQPETDENTIKLERSTFQILTELQGVIPNSPVSEHDIFKVMKELGFRIEKKIFYERVCTFPEDVENGRPPVYENKETYRAMLWSMYEKK